LLRGYSDLIAKLDNVGGNYLAWRWIKICILNIIK
jgi:hypothetical protein